MKKTISLLVAFGLSITLCACNAKDPENLLETQAPTKTVQEEPSSPVVIEEGYYQYGNMQVSVPAGDFILYGDQVLFEVIPDGHSLLCTYDLSTGKVNTLCKDATCTHGSACPSGGADCNLEQYQGKLYARNYSRQITQFVDGRFEKITDGGVFCFWHANGNLYAVTDDHALVVFENGSHTPRILIDEYAEHWNVVFGHYLYSGFGRCCRVDLSAENPQLEVLVEDADCKTDGRYIYYLDHKYYHLYRCNMDGSNPELLIDQSVFTGSLNFDDEYLYFRLCKDEYELYGEGSNVLYRAPKSDPTQMEQIAQLPEPIETVHTVPGYDLLFVGTIDLGECVDGFYPDAIRYNYVMHTDGSNMTHLELPDF